MTLKRVEWAKVVGEWRASRLSAREFASRRGVTDTALRYWANRFEEEPAPVERGRRREARAASSSPPLARVVRAGEGATSSGGRIMVVVGKASVVVEPGFDGALLRDLVHALGEVG